MPMTQDQINKKYRGRYIEIYKTYNYDLKRWDYEVGKVSKTIKENMTLGQDVGTDNEYCR